MAVRGYPVRTPERISEAIRMRDEGMAYSKIGAHFGVTAGTAFNWVTDTDGTRAGARKKGYGQPCPGCGGAKYYLSAHCASCESALRLESSAWDIVNGLREWNELTGRPPGAVDWNSAHPGHRVRPQTTHRSWPSQATVSNLFGSWNTAIAVAGFVPLTCGQRRDPEAHRAAVRTARRDMSRTLEKVAEVRSKVFYLWFTDLTLTEIADRLDMSTKAVQGHVRRMRNEGIDIPRRQGGRRKKAPA